MLGYAEMLQIQLEDQPKLAGYAQQVFHAGERGAKLTKKMLSFSQQVAPQTSAIDINALLYKQQDMLAKTLTVRIALKIEIEPTNRNFTSMATTSTHPLCHQPTKTRFITQTRCLQSPAVDNQAQLMHLDCTLNCTLNFVMRSHKSNLILPSCYPKSQVFE
jgi:hypothetical protein